MHIFHFTPYMAYSYIAIYRAVITTNLKEMGTLSYLLCCFILSIKKQVFIVPHYSAVRFPMFLFSLECNEGNS